jgi:ABC-type nickel/cobalt efflux system permease component RcnA
MLQDLIAAQRDIYLAFGDAITAFADGGSWQAFASAMPMGIVFGAVHALTPGHGKALLATYLAASPTGAARALAVALLLAFTHISMSVLIVALSLPLVSVALGNVGHAPVLEDVSRGLLGVIGL